MENKPIARTLRLLSQLMELHDENPFKIKSLANAAFKVDKLPYPAANKSLAELEKIEKYLSPKDDQSLRTYTIYGRRGVGKTEIALQFAYMNQPGFDAIFWIQCETSVAIRQSFTNVAVALNLPAADRDGHHEENQLAVQNWLKKTCWSSLDEQLYLGY